MAYGLDFVRGMDEEGLRLLLEQAEVSISHWNCPNRMIKTFLTGFWFEEGFGRSWLCLWKEGNNFAQKQSKNCVALQNKSFNLLGDGRGC